MIVPGPDNPIFRVVRGLVYLWIGVLILALDPRTEDPATPVKLLASAIAAISTTTLWAVAVRTGCAPYRRMNPVLWYLFFFFFALGVSGMFSGTPDRARMALCPWIVFAILGFVVYQTFPHAGHLRNLFRVITACIALSSIYGLAQHVGWDPFPWAMRDTEEYRALPSTYGNPNLAGHVLVVGLILCAGLLGDLWEQKRPLREYLFYIALCILMATHLALTRMRGGLAALAFAMLFCAFYGALRRTRRSRRQSAAMALFSCGGLVALLTLAALILAPELNLDSSLQLRLNGYAGAAALFLDHPFLGVGPGNYPFYAIAHWSPFESLWYALEGNRNFHVHNEWLEMAAECGVTGLAGLIGLVVFGVVMFFDNPWLGAEKHRALLLAIPAAVVATATDACFGFNLHAPVSAGLLFTLIPQGTIRPYYSPPVRNRVRKGALLMAVLALGASWPLVRNYSQERAFQYAQGAVAWERAQRATSHSEDNVSFATRVLEKLTTDWPDDYRGWMLLGDFLIEANSPERAIDALLRALELHPLLPRLHIQLARAEIQLAQKNVTDWDIHLNTALHHAQLARERCPDLAEAWELLGWCSFIRSNRSKSESERQNAIAEFRQAQRLGRSAEIQIDRALGELYERGDAWVEAAQAWERCIMHAPEALDCWQRWVLAAERAGGTSLDTFRQSLLHQLYRQSEVSAPTATALATWGAGTLARLARTPVQIAVTRKALEAGLTRSPDLAEVWGAWLGLSGQASPSAELSEFLHQLTATQQASVSPLILAIDQACVNPNIDTLTEAASLLSSTLATVPGGEDMKRQAPYASLVALLDHLVDTFDSPDILPGTIPFNLGVAHFEIGDPVGADEKLAASETRLTERARAACWYYRSRALYAQARSDEALALAKRALDTDAGHPEYQWQYARCLQATGHTEAATFVYDSLLSGLPQDHPFRERIANEKNTNIPIGARP